MGRFRGMVRPWEFFDAPHCSLSTTRWPFPRFGTVELVNWLYGLYKCHSLTRLVVVVVAKIDGFITGQLGLGSIEFHVEHNQSGGQDQQDQRDQQDGVPGDPPRWRLITTSIGVAITICIVAVDSLISESQSISICDSQKPRNCIVSMDILT